MGRIEGLRIGGTPIESHMLGLVQDGLSIGQAKPVTSAEQIPGRGGMLDVTLEDACGNAYHDMREITVGMYVIGDEDDIISAKRWLGEYNGRNTTLAWRALPGEYRGRLSVGEWHDGWSMGRMTHATVEITMNAMPYLYGHTKRVRLNEGRNVLAVDGNRPCWPAWDLSLDSGTETMSIAYGNEALTVSAGTPMTGSVTISTGPSDRETRINGNLTTPTIESDYFPLRPGVAEIILTGCSGTVEYEPLTII